MIQTFADVPIDTLVPEKIKDEIMHVSLPVGSSVPMGSDRGPGFGPPPNGNPLTGSARRRGFD